MATMASLEKSQIFWKNICQSTSLVKNLVGLQNLEQSFTLIFSGKSIKLNVHSAVPVGTNFLSDVFALSATGDDGLCYDCFIKVIPSHPSRVAAAVISGYYEREIFFYQDWLPKLAEIRFSKNLFHEDIPLNIPKPFYLNLVKDQEGNTYGKDTVYILENLKLRDFKMAPSASQPSGIDIEHAQLAVRSYANYHALSIANYRQLLGKTPASFEVFQRDPNYVSPVGVYRTLVLPKYVVVLHHFQQTEAAEWLDGLSSELERIWDWPSFMDAGTLTCLIHGDSWSNNILYRYDSNQRPVEMMMVDWQIARYGHPFVDLGYYLFTSTSSELRRLHLDRLLIDYFATLKSALSKLDISLDEEGYTQDRFVQEAKQRYVYSMFQAFFLLPVLLDSSKAAEHSLSDRDENSKKATGNAKEDLDEEGTTKGWESLFEPSTVVSNSVLSDRLVGLILDVMKASLN